MSLIYETLDSVDEIKNKLQDVEYKTIVENLQKLNNTLNELEKENKKLNCVCKTLKDLLVRGQNTKYVDNIYRPFYTTNSIISIQYSKRHYKPKQTSVI